MPEKEKKIYRLSEIEAKHHFESFCPPANYEMGKNILQDQLLLAKTNAAWKRLAATKGFDWETVEPHPSGSALLFYAVPLDD